MNYIDDYFKQLVNHLKKKTKEEIYGDMVYQYKRLNQNIKNSLEKIKCDLSTDETILFDGEPMCKEAIESLLTAMEVGLSLVKQKQKRDNKI